ncbi:uncharacterized protein UTRI_03377_B [Ustilago trichophora]|uniref:Uncharacterized protein n=1 Tax=Ustilago trichophora TaxID=86804 RepID=A0A5C3E3G3_9BASI|nr:uncharacterized protein UTRI_03377_B [Ustilago trichophora]
MCQSNRPQELHMPKPSTLKDVGAMFGPLLRLSVSLSLSLVLNSMHHQKRSSTTCLPPFAAQMIQAFT